MQKEIKKMRMPAEWENPERILLAFPSEETDWAYILNEATDQFIRLLEALAAGGEKILLLATDDTPEKATRLVEENGGTVVKTVEFNDTWTRDYGPITIEDNGALKELDFGFNGWGLKFAADKDNLANLRLTQEGYRDIANYSNNRDYELEGGSIETDGKGTILTTSRCLCSPNRNGGKSKQEIEKILKERLGAERVLWLDHGFLAGDDTDSHIDTLARMAPNDTIIYTGTPEDQNDIHFQELLKMENQLKSLRTKEGEPYRLQALPFPDPIFDENGERLPATYANYLVTGSNLYVPTYGQPGKDRKAISKISEIFPDHKVWAVDCRTLIKQHGSLHCSTMQLYI